MRFNSRYSKLNSDLQDYVVSNISKSFCLFLMCTLGSRLVMQPFYDDWPQLAWNNGRFNVCIYRFCIIVYSKET